MAYRIYPLGDQALTVDWGNRIDEELNHRVLALYAHLQQISLPGLLNLTPAYSSLTVVYDTAMVQEKHPDRAPFDTMRNLVEHALSAGLKKTAITPGRQVEIPVCYDPVLAPDLEALATGCRLTVDAVVRLHSTPLYRVYMLGFLPGFAYMGRVAAQIAAPRLAHPRTRVPAGSVGIAGEQTGIYPLESAGGWNLIGRTPIRLFDPDQAAPALLQPGDMVHFFPISLAQFHQQTPSGS